MNPLIYKFINKRVRLIKKKLANFKLSLPPKFVRLMFKSGLYSKKIFLSWFLRLLIKSGSFSRASIIGAGTVYCERSKWTIQKQTTNYRIFFFRKLPLRIFFWSRKRRYWASISIGRNSTLIGLILGFSHLPSSFLAPQFVTILMSGQLGYRHSEKRTRDCVNLVFSL